MRFTPTGFTVHFFPWTPEGSRMRGIKGAPAKDAFSKLWRGPANISKEFTTLASKFFCTQGAFIFRHGFSAFFDGLLTSLFIENLRNMELQSWWFRDPGDPKSATVSLELGEKASHSSKLLGDDESVSICFEPYHPTVNEKTGEKSRDVTSLAAIMCEENDAVVHIGDHLARITLDSELDVPFITSWSSGAPSKQIYLKVTDTTKPTKVRLNALKSLHPRAGVASHKQIKDGYEIGNEVIYTDIPLPPVVSSRLQANLRSLLVDLILEQLTHKGFLDGLSAPRPLYP
ncbi:hypothetical protein DL95DRAFT_452787 [Leptodontidium sp. 2 PMI_412]|nr:hypothetical protein DL95DRAFT_452787 [Leptodontidium sp. 2 PMI_412]